MPFYCPGTKHTDGISTCCVCGRIMENDIRQVILEEFEDVIEEGEAEIHTQCNTCTDENEINEYYYE